MHLVGFIIRIYHDVLSSECQVHDIVVHTVMLLEMYSLVHHNCNGCLQLSLIITHLVQKYTTQKY